MKKYTLLACLGAIASLYAVGAASYAQTPKTEPKTLHVTIYTPGHDYVNKNHITAVGCDGQFSESIMRRSGAGSTVKTDYTITLVRTPAGVCNLVVTHRGRDPSYLNAGEVPLVDGLLTLPIDFSELEDIRSTHQAGPWFVSLKGQK